MTHLPTAIAVLALLPLAPAWSATYTFATAVVESDDAPSVLDLPGLGTGGTIAITFDGAALDADPTAPAFGMPFPELPGVSVDYISAGLSSSLPIPSAFAFGGGVRFSNSDFSSIEVAVPGTDCSSIDCTFAGSFYFTGPASTPAPSNYADVEAILANPATFAAFSFNGTIAPDTLPDSTDDFISFRAEAAIAPIPLPAAGWMLLTAFGLLGAARSQRG